MKKKYPILLLLYISILTFFASCEWEKLPAPKVPHIPVPTQNLEAGYTTLAPNSINSPYWSEADYKEVSLEELSKGNLYSDGYLNMTGLFEGISNFNNGDSIKLQLKAAYDDQYVYILAQWNDSDFDASFSSLLWDGAEDELKQDSATGWTSQRNSDNFTIFFENETIKDAWQWNMALSAPIQLAIDMHHSNGEYLKDDGTFWAVRNSTTNTSARVAPAYEWNGELQQITTDDGTTILLDPAYYLLDDYKIDFVGDIAQGDIAFANKCQSCHGQNGSGEGGENVYGPPVNMVEYNRLSRQAMIDVIAEGAHDGSSYFDDLNETQAENLVSRMRTFGGLPGYYFTNPAGSVADVKVVSNVNFAKIQARDGETYKILFIRKLSTGNDDDIEFNPANLNYTFGVNLTDNDNINFIGKENLTLTFKPIETDE